ncbi:MAG: hypothetical protein ABIJ53_08605 [Verrucomicrobiota bacterium]
MPIRQRIADLGLLTRLQRYAQYCGQVADYSIGNQQPEIKN